MSDLPTVNEDIQTDYTQIGTVYAACLAVVKVVYLHYTLSSLEIQERWKIEMVEEEQRAIILAQVGGRVENEIINIRMKSETAPLLVNIPPSDSNLLFRLVYSSAAAATLAEAVPTISSLSASYNSKHNLSSHLLFTSPFLFQVLEGPFFELESVWPKIYFNRHHHNVSLISCTHCKKRVFRERGLRITTIHPCSGLKGTTILGLFQTLGHITMTSMVYDGFYQSDKNRNRVITDDVIEDKEVTTQSGKHVQIIALVFSVVDDECREEISSTLSGILQTSWVNDLQEIFSSRDRIVFATPVSTNAVDLAVFLTEEINTRHSGATCSFGIASGNIYSCIRKTCISSHSYIGKPINDAIWEAFNKMSLPQFSNLNIRDSPYEFDFPQDALVQLIYTGIPKDLTTVAGSVRLIISQVSSEVFDKMIIIGSQKCNILLHVMEGTYSDLGSIFATLQSPNSILKHCWLSSISNITDRTLDDDVSPLQIIGGDLWGQTLRLVTKHISPKMIPEVLRGLSSKNLSLASVGRMVLEVRVYVTVIPCSVDEDLEKCFNLIINSAKGLRWLDFIEISDRISLSCSEDNIIRMFHFCIAISKVIKLRIGSQSWLAIGLSAGKSTMGHIRNPLKPLFYICGEHVHRSWLLSTTVMKKSNARGSSFLATPEAVQLARLYSPYDPVIGVGSCGMSKLATWDVFSVDHPNTDMPSRSSSSPYYLCKRPLQLSSIEDIMLE